jgi:hypothetical protein
MAIARALRKRIADRSPPPLQSWVNWMGALGFLFPLLIGAQCIRLSLSAHEDSDFYVFSGIACIAAASVIPVALILIVDRGKLRQAPSSEKKPARSMLIEGLPPRTLN